MRHKLNRIRRFGGAAILIALGSAQAVAAPAQSKDAQYRPSTARYAIVGATLIDGTDKPPVADSAVIVRGDTIEWVGTRSALPKGVKIVEARGEWLVPGLIDAHTHLWESGRLSSSPKSYDVTSVISYADEVAWVKSRVRYTLSRYICAGVTSMVSLGGPRLEFDARDLAKRTTNAPTVFVAYGPIVGFQSEIMFPKFDGDIQIYTANTNAEVERAIAEATERKSDLIKTAFVGGPLTPLEQRFKAIYPFLVQQAHKSGFKVTGHATAYDTAVEALRDGTDSLQHLPWDRAVDDDLIKLVRARDTVIVPTLAIIVRGAQRAKKDFQLEPIEEQCGDPQVIQSWHDPRLQNKKAAPERGNPLPMLFKSVAALNAADVRLGAGSDSGNIGMLHGASLHYELKLMQDAGVSPAKLIRAATSINAVTIGKENLVGSIAAGKQADLLILRANPLIDIRNLQQIDVVIARGVRLTQSRLRSKPTD